MYLVKHDAGYTDVIIYNHIAEVDFRECLWFLPVYPFHRTWVLLIKQITV